MAKKYHTGTIYKMLSEQGTFLKSKLADIDFKLVQIYADALSLQKEYNAKGLVFINNAQDSFSLTLGAIMHDDEIKPLYDKYSLDFNNGTSFGLEGDEFEISEHPTEDLFYLFKSEQLNNMFYIWLQEAIWRSDLLKLPMLLLYGKDYDLDSFIDLRDGTPDSDDFSILEDKYSNIFTIRLPAPQETLLPVKPDENKITTNPHKFYAVTLALNTSLAGAEPYYDYDSPHSQFNLTMWDFAEHKPHFSKLVFNSKNAKMVDFIKPSTLGGGGFVISERIKELLEGFEIMPHNIYKLPEYQSKDKVYQYYFLHLPINHDDFSNMDFNKSEFYSDERDDDFEWGNNVKKIKANNAEEFSKIIAEDDIDSFSIILLYNKLALNKKPADIFAIREVEQTSYIFSERLKLALEAIRVTGIKDFDEIEISF